MRTSKRSNATPAKPVRPFEGIESLESRIAPAAFAALVNLDGDGKQDDVRIVGDGLRNIVTILDDGANTLTISIDADGDGDLTGKNDLSPTTFTSTDGSVALDVKLGGGNDVLNYTLTGNVSAGSRVIGIDLGPGKNTLNFSTGTNNVLNGSSLRLEVFAGTGADTVGITFNEVRKSSVITEVALGKGNDTANVAFDRIDDGSSLDLSMDLDAGNNIATVDLQEVGFADYATANVNVLAGTGKDRVTTNLHDDLGNGAKASHLSIVAALGAGDDVFAANLDYTGSVFRVDDHSVASIVVDGGAGNDDLSVKGVGNTGTIRLDPDALLQVDLHVGAGNDTMTLDLGKANALQLLGQFRARLDGGLGRDILSAKLAYDTATTGIFDVAVLGGQGDDQATFQLSGAAGGTPTYGPTGKALLDGGLGTDILTNLSPAVSVTTRFEQVT